MQTDPKPTMIGVVARDRPGQLFARESFPSNRMSSDNDNH
jgi:hypothetical protein